MTCPRAPCPFRRGRVAAGAAGASERPRPKIAWPAKRGSIPIVVDKVLDTVGDIALHTRRYLTEPAV